MEKVMEILIVLNCFIFLQALVVATSEKLDGTELELRTRNRLGTLYKIRSKLRSQYPRQSSSGANSQPQTGPNRKQTHDTGRDYAVHYSAHDVINPTQYSSNSLISKRIGRISYPEISIGKLLHTDDVTKILNFTLTNNKWKQKSGKQLNKEFVMSTHPSENEISEISFPNKTELIGDVSIGQSTPPSISSTLHQIHAIGQGINYAVTVILTRKLMKMLDRDVPPGLFTPMKHLVASGNQMIEYWDRRASARDGKTPGIVDTLGYGLEQLKKFREGETDIDPSDPVANLTSPAKTFIQGVVTVKRLTSRIMGQDTKNEFKERGYDSYGHGGYGHHAGYGHGGGGLYGGLDPFSLIAALAFGAFLLQLLLTLLATGARSMNIVNLNTPFRRSSDIQLPQFLTSADKLFGTPTIRSKRHVYGDIGEEMFDALVDKLDGVYKTYKEIKRVPKCARISLCQLAKEDFDSESKSILAPLYTYGLGQLGRDVDASAFVKSIEEQLGRGETVDCSAIVKGCHGTMDGDEVNLTPTKQSHL